MTKEEAIKVLDALAEGCSPFTGEILEDHFILNERQVIRALQKAIDSLSSNNAPEEKIQESQSESVHLKMENEDILSALKFLKKEGIYPTPSKLTRFFLGSKSLSTEALRQSNLFGLLRYDYTYNSLKPFMAKFMKDNPGILPPNQKDKNPWAHIDYFQQKTFCRLSEKAINQLKEKIANIPLVKTEHNDNLPEYVANARKEYLRAYEPWSEQELELLSKAIFYTNDLNILSSSFQRGHGSISSCGKRLIYEGKTEIVPATDK